MMKIGIGYQVSGMGLSDVILTKVRISRQLLRGLGSRPSPG